MLAHYARSAPYLRIICDHDSHRIITYRHLSPTRNMSVLPQIPLSNLDLPTKLNQCHKCFNLVSHGSRAHFDGVSNGEMNGILQMRCTHPHCSNRRQWFCCTEHNRKFQRRYEAVAHINHCHASETVSSNVNDNSLDDSFNDSLDDSFPFDASTFSDNEESQETENSFAFDDSSWSDSAMPRSAQRYYTEEAAEEGLGIRKIVARAFAQHDETDNTPTLQEAQYHLAIARFAKSLQGKQLHQFVQILHQTVEALVETNVGDSQKRRRRDPPSRSPEQHLQYSSFLTDDVIADDGSEACASDVQPPSDSSNSQLRLTVTRVPTSKSDMSRIYLTGRHSIISNLPQLHAEEYQGHGYIPLKQIVELFIAQGLPTDSITLGDPASTTAECVNDDDSDNVRSSYSQTMDAAELRSWLEEHLGDASAGVMVLHIKKWSDGFEATSNQQSLWVVTVTISPPPGMSSSSKYTFAVAMGRKGVNHLAVLERLHQEMQELSTPTLMYSSVLKKFIRVVVVPTAYLADKPEKAFVTSTLSHSSTLAKRTMWSMKPNLAFLPACRGCHGNRLIRLLATPSRLSLAQNTACNNCSDWNSLPLEAGFILCKDYPTSIHPQSPPPPPGREPRQRNVHGNVLLPPIMLHIKQLMQAAKCCFFNVAVGHWTTIKETAAFLRLNGIPSSNDKENKSIGRRLFIDRPRQLKESLHPIDPSSFQVDTHIEYPPFWTSGMQLRQCLECPMHALPLGVGKKTHIVETEWMKDKLHIHKSVGDAAVDTMETVRLLQLDWYQLSSFGGGREYTVGGWNASHHLAFIRHQPVYSLQVKDQFVKKYPNRDQQLSRTFNAYMRVADSLYCMVSRLLTARHRREGSRREAKLAGVRHYREGSRRTENGTNEWMDSRRKKNNNMRRHNADVRENPLLVFEARRVQRDTFPGNHVLLVQLWAEEKRTSMTWGKIQRHSDK